MKNKRYVQIRTRNFTAKPLRGKMVSNEKVVVRLGSHTPTNQIFANPRGVIEINTTEAIENSRNKLRMKECFKKLDVPQAEWWTFDKQLKSSELPYPIVIKRVCGFQGKGMELINNNDEFVEWLRIHRGDLSGWFIEKFFNGAREYRLHVASTIGVFMSWRKLRNKEAKERWFFNSVNSNWVGVDHELFDKPKCWKLMEEAASNCIKSTGLDIGAVDIRVQSNDKKDPKFIVCEINSAPALGDLGIEKYKEVIQKLIKSKTYE